MLEEDDPGEPEKRFKFMDRLVIATLIEDCWGVVCGRSEYWPNSSHRHRDLGSSPILGYDLVDRAKPEKK